MNTILATASSSHDTNAILHHMRAGMEAMRKQGFNGAVYNAEYEKAARTLASCDNSVQQAHSQGFYGATASDFHAKIAKAREDAVAEWTAFVGRMITLDHWHTVNYPKTLKGEQEREALMQAAVFAAHHAKIAAEQAIVDAVIHAIDTVTEAGGWINVVTDVSHTISWGQTDVHVRKSVQINGIDVSALPFDVRQTILTHGERIAGEVMARQAAALAAPAPEPVVVEAV
jgi:hypothetical protein